MVKKSVECLSAIRRPRLRSCAVLLAGEEDFSGVVVDGTKGGGEGEDSTLDRQVQRLQRQLR